MSPKRRLFKDRFSQKLFIIIIIFNCFFLIVKMSNAQEGQKDEPEKQSEQSLNTKLADLEEIILQQDKIQLELETEIVNLKEKIITLEKEKAILESMLATQVTDLRSPELIKADENNLNKTIYLNLGFAYARKGQNKEAIEKYQQALKYDPLDEDIHYNLGYLLSKENEYKLAIEEYKKAIVGLPKDRQVYYNLAIIYATALRDNKAAGEYYQRFLRLSTDID